MVKPTGSAALITVLLAWPELVSGLKDSAVTLTHETACRGYDYSVTCCGASRVNCKSLQEFSSPARYFSRSLTSWVTSFSERSLLLSSFPSPVVALVGTSVLETITEMPCLFSAPGPDKATSTHRIDLDSATSPINTENITRLHSWGNHGILSVSLPAAKEWASTFRPLLTGKKREEWNKRRRFSSKVLS